MSSKIFTSPIPYLALLLAHIIWGGNFVVAKVTLLEFPPMTLAFLRFAIASLLLAPFLIAEHKKIKINPKDLPKLIAIGVFIIGLNIAFFFEGIKRTSVTDASILSLIIPMSSVLSGWWFLREKVFLYNIFGIILGFIGAAVIIGLPQLISGNMPTTVLLGNFLIILACLSFVIGAVISKPILKKYSSLVVTAVAFLVGTLVFIIPAGFEYLESPGWVYKVSILGILGLLYMTLLSSVSAYFLFEWGLARTTVAAADLFSYIEPAIATFLAIAILGEEISPSFLLGAALIVAGVYLGTLAKEAHHRHHKAHRV